jgi:hypothetical protein
LTDEQILAFLTVSLQRMGADELITPREITRDFLNILDLMYSDPKADFDTLLGRTEKKETKDEKGENPDSDDDFFDLSEFKL